MANSQVPPLRGLVLSANELANLTNWPSPLIEDYLTIYQSLVSIAEVVDQKEDVTKTVVVVTAAESPYSIEDEDQQLFFDTTSGDIVATLPAGVVGREFRIINYGTGNNVVVLTPRPGEFLFGDLSSEDIYDSEVVILMYSDAAGWY